MSGFYAVCPILKQAGYGYCSSSDDGAIKLCLECVLPKCYEEVTHDRQLLMKFMKKFNKVLVPVKA